MVDAHVVDDQETVMAFLYNFDGDRWILAVVLV